MDPSLHRGLLVVCCCLVGAGLAVGPAAADQRVPVVEDPAVAGGHGGDHGAVAVVPAPGPGGTPAAVAQTDGNETTDNGTAGNATTANETDEPPPTVALSLDGDRLSSDSYPVVASDPTLTVEAAVGEPANGTELETVEVRIDSGVVRSYSVDGESATVSLSLPLSTGNNTVSVLVEDTADRLTQERVVVAKDDIAPWVGLTSPRETDPRAVVPNLTVQESLVTFGVDVVEFSALREASIKIVGDHGRDAVFLSDPEKRFERDLLVGPGNSTGVIRMTDALGNVRTQTFRVRLNDSTAPRARLDPYPAQTTERTVTLTGTLVDNVWVRNATITVDHLDASNRTGVTNYTQSLGRDAGYEFSRSGRRVPFEQELLLKHGRNRIEIRANDHRGQTGNRTIVVERVRERRTDRNAPPLVTLDTNRTRLRPDGRVRIVAHVTDETLNLRSVTAETRTLDNDVVDFERFTDLDSPHRVVLNTTLRAADGTTVVRVRATDDEGARGAAVQQVADVTTPTPQPTDAPATTTVATATAASADGRTVTPQRRPPRTTTAAGNTTGNGLPVVGSVGGVVGGVAGVLAGIAPFTAGSFAFVVVTYVVVRQITDRRKQAS